MYSLARSKGCKLGSRFRVCLATFDPGACADAADLLRALIFILRVEVRVTILAAGAREISVRTGAKTPRFCRAGKTSEPRTSTFWHLRLPSQYDQHPSPPPATNSKDEVVSCPETPRETHWRGAEWTARLRWEDSSANSQLLAFGAPTNREWNTADFIFSAASRSDALSYVNFHSNCPPQPSYRLSRSSPAVAMPARSASSSSRWTTAPSRTPSPTPSSPESSATRHKSPAACRKPSSRRSPRSSLSSSR